MGITSAGLLLYRISPGGVVEVLLAHPGGPFWARKDDAAWSVPKGEYPADEDPLGAAYREFEEEVGLPVPGGQAVFLGELRQPGGKRVSVWALEADLDITHSSSNTFELEWPRGSGKIREFPEIDRVEWMSVDGAGRKLVKGQIPFLAVLLETLGRAPDRAGPGSTTPTAG
jgi:predicted NUDIX family NTP pyrophosphohydrolase